MKKDNTVISVVLLLFTVLFIMSFSIALPIFIRPFYYAHIDTYDLSETSGFTKNEIIEAYDETLDYLTNPLKSTFSAGCMKFSNAGASHFRDCKKLFTINTIILSLSFTAIIIITFFLLRKKVMMIHFIGHSPFFWSGIVTIILPLICGIAISLNPNRAFIVFHKIFFPGKTNWIFNPNTDEIISVLPQQFFYNCAILIGVGIITLSALCIIFDIIIKRRNEK